ncbi:4-alpha-glucanotransferase [Paludibacter sp.]
MQIKFELNHKVLFGQSIYLYGSIPELGNDVEYNSHAMICIESNLWVLDVNIDRNIEEFDYYYLVKDNNSNIISRGQKRTVSTYETEVVVIRDNWEQASQQNFLYTSAFTDVFFSHPKADKKPKLNKSTYLIKVDCPYVTKNQSLVLCGESELLGNWDINKAYRFEYVGSGQWQLTFPASKVKSPLQYKLAIADNSTGDIVHWEERHNRELLPVKKQTDGKELYVISINYAYRWINWKASGVAIPVFSIRTEKSAGVGDFADIKLLADWAASTGQKVIQILPINDTTISRKWTDSYPYNAISIYALHPLYFAFSSYKLKNKDLQKECDDKAVYLNSLDAIDYESVMKLKEDFIDALYIEIGNEILKSADYKKFFSNNEHWIFAYACFSVLRDLNKTANYNDWKLFKKYDKKKLEKYFNEDEIISESLKRIYFTQYLLHTQLLDAAEYVHEKGLILKGDIPIGISHDSVEAWTEPHLFNLDVQTGAPPDDFSVNGQNWGFPTYNWDAIAKEDYRWWKNRFRKMADYFDAYRIDHILGFFRIWEIPAHSVQGLLGYFSPALPFSTDEIHGYGLFLDDQRMTQPFIHEHFLYEIFGEFTEEVIGSFLQPITWQRFELKEFCNTQQKVKALFKDSSDYKCDKIKNGLYALCNEVLFVKDKREPEKYHPRISAQHTFSYKYLNDYEKESFNRLYDHFFYQRHNDFWANQAFQKIPALISSTRMLVCGEDLGMIPDCVPHVMKVLQILSLEIQRMPKSYNLLFENLAELPYMSVCTTSTHDMSPIRSWWEENRENTQRYYNEILWKEGEAPKICTTEIAEQILRNHLNSPAMLAIIPLQDWLSVSDKLRFPNPVDERINIPAISQHYWRYRMHLTVEQLINETEYNEQIYRVLKESWRI